MGEDGTLEGCFCKYLLAWQYVTLPMLTWRIRDETLWTILELRDLSEILYPTKLCTLSNRRLKLLVIFKFFKYINLLCI